MDEDSNDLLSELIAAREKLEHQIDQITIGAPSMYSRNRGVQFNELLAQLNSELADIKECIANLQPDEASPL